MTCDLQAQDETSQHTDSIYCRIHGTVLLATSTSGLRKVQPKHVSGLVLRQLGRARQPMTGWCDARLLAGMLDFSVSKYYLASANII